MDMNPMGGFDKSRFNKIRWILLSVLVVWLALEFGAFYLANYLVGSTVSFYIIVGFIILGFIIKPKQPENRPSLNNPEELAAYKEKLSKSFLSRKLASIFFIIPTYLTNIVAILMLITPVRHFLQRKLIQKLAPPGIANLMSGESGNPFAGFGQNMGGFGQNMGGFGQNMGGFGQNMGGFGQNMGGFGQNMGGFGEQSKTKQKKRKSSDDFIDVDDYDIEGGKRDETSVKVDRPEPKAPKALEAEVIDVDHEWKS